MIKRLKRKFILVAMLAVFTVLSALILTINLVNYTRVANYADTVLEYLYENNGKFPFADNELPTSDFVDMDDNDANGPFPDREGMNEETPYETRYFTVRFVGDYAITDLRYIAAVTEEEATVLAEKAVLKHKTKGYLGDYRYLVADNETFVLFVDCTRQMSSADEFLKVSLIVSSVGVVAVFVLLVIFSTFIVRPLVESYEKQKQFITDASHELKTPLTVISANNELIELTTGETAETTVIARQVKRLTGMVKNMTALSKIDEESKLTDKTDVHLSDMLIDQAETFRANLEEKERKFNVNIEDGIVVRGDEELLRQLSSIVLENASKYAKSFTSLTLSQKNKRAFIEVENDAEGVSVGNMDMCFERFYRTNSARASAVSGTGIGLSIAKSIVELHGGTINAVGSENGVFKIKISLHALNK